VGLPRALTLTDEEHLSELPFGRDSVTESTNPTKTVTDALRHTRHRCRET